VDSGGLASHGGDTVTLEATNAVVTVSATLADVAPIEVRVPPTDAYALRIFAGRRLYVRGVAVRGSSSLAGLVPTPTIALNHFDLDRLGAVPGDVVTVRTEHGSVALPVALDDQLARGVAGVPVSTRTAEDEDALASLLERDAVITQVRLETR
jgi:anaerobic selenocysteine-containing dehydrogenase